VATGLLVAAAPAGADPVAHVVQVTGAVQHAVPAGFLGLSVSDAEMSNYADAPALPRMLAAIHPDGGPLSLRVGGQIADRTVWLGAQRFIAPRYAMPAPYLVGPAWMGELASLARRTHSHVILDVNAADHSPAADAALVSAARDALGSRLTQLAIGNEPDLYGKGEVGEDRHPGAWADGFDPHDYARLFADLAPALRHAAPGRSLIGPETAYPGPLWSETLLDSHAPVGELAVHTYPMITCAQPGNYRYPTVPGYLSDHTLNLWTRLDKRQEQFASEHDVPLRITEFGASACHGLAGITNSEATSLWVINQLFSLASDGIAGVNVHVRSAGISSALQASADGVLRAQALFYGLAMFARAVGPHAQILREAAAPVDQLHVWSVASTLGLRVVAVNTGRRAQRVTLAAPAHGDASVQTLTGRSASATRVTLDGQTVTPDGVWQGRRRLGAVADRGGRWTITVPAHSAQLVALHPAAG
jgi:hypothetical protein